MKFTLCLVLGAVAITSTYADDGSSGPTACPSLCNDLWQPVCGSDGVTYSNECYLLLADCESQERITKAYDGECVDETTSTDTSGSDGCPDICTLIFRPVCGSDGVTYGNDCLLGVAQCQSGGAITQVSEGECPGSSNESSEAGSDGCSDVCIEIFRPVCGTDGVTYANSCFLSIATCNDPSITLAHNGACEGTSLSSEGSFETGNPSTDSSDNTDCPDTCIEILRPVCGSDGVTYANSCFLDVASCHDPNITLAHNGACEGASLSSEGSYESGNPSTNSSTSTDSSHETTCPSVCPAIYAPVCGSDGVTYANECKLEVASCNHPELCLTKVSDGACAPVECKTY